MKIKACLFDLDGVIVSTAEQHYLAWRKIADKLGFRFTAEDNEQLKGVSRTESLNRLLNVGNIDLPDDQKTELAELKNKIYIESISIIDEHAILPGVTGFLKILKDNDILTGIGSASKNTKLILNNIGLLNAFDTIVDGNMTSRAKPDPEVFLLGAQSLNIEASQCVIFEDSQAGIDAGIRAGMHTVGVGDQNILAKAEKVISGFSGAGIDLIRF